MHGEARRHAMGMIAAGAMLVLLVLAMASAITVAADGQPVGEPTGGKSNRDVLEGLDATRFAQPPPPTPPLGIIGGYYPFYTSGQSLTTPPPMPTQPPFAGTQSDDGNIRDR